MTRLISDETGGHGGDLAAALRKWSPDGEFVDFSSNINPLGPPSGLIEYLADRLPAMTAYPTPQARELREKLSVAFGISEQRLILGNGANELIHLIMLWKKPRRVLVPAPSFSEYERAARLSGAQVTYFPLPPGKPLDPEAVVSSLEKEDLLVFCNPNNPTGQLYRQNDLILIAGEAEKRGAMVMVDESFIPLTGKDDQSLRDLKLGNLWVVVSLTKIWGLPGLRIGFAGGPEAEVEELSRWGDPWRVNFLAQHAGLYCIGCKSYIDKTLALIKKEREFLTRRLRDAGKFKVYDSAANYLLLQAVDPAFTVPVFQDALARRGLLIRRADNFPGLDQRYLRIAVKKRPDNLRLLQEFDKWFARSTKEAGGAG